MFRYDWYQSEEFVFITIRQKGLTLDDCSVVYDGANLTVSSNGQLIFLAPLFCPINKDNITLTCTPNKVRLPFVRVKDIKVEVRLKKITGERWPSLSQEEEKRPSTSTKNWNAIEKEADKEEDGDVQSLFQVRFALISY